MAVIQVPNDILNAWKWKTVGDSLFVELPIISARAPRAILLRGHVKRQSEIALASAVFPKPRQLVEIFFGNLHLSQ